MFSKKRLYPLIGAAILLLALLVAGAALAAPPEPQEIHGLQERPDIPVSSVILRRPFPDHPLGGPPGLGGQQPAPPSGGCDKDIDTTSTISGVTFVTAQNNTICTSADIDTFSTASADYVVQAGGEEAAWTQTQVDSSGMPVAFNQFVWSGSAGRNTYTPDVKAFSQGSSNYIAMGLERMTVNAFCGVVIVNVTDPANPVIESQYIGADWCDTHNVFVETVGGEGAYIYATADGPNDMRVLAVNGLNGGTVQSPAEVGRYIAPTANNDNYVHDITVIDHGGAIGRRAYLAYWDTGLVVLNAADVTPGTNPTPVIGPNQLDPPNFFNHHSFPTADGNTVFIQDEFLGASGDEPVQMWDISNPSSPAYVDGLALGTDVPVNPAHNLEIRYDLYPNRLFVGWYKLGLQAFDFDGTGFTGRALYHQVQTEAADDVYDGAWGVRLMTLGGDTYVFQSDRRYGLIVDCITCTPPPAVVIHVGDLDGSSSAGRGNKWNATVTITVHDAGEAPVADATVSGSWSVGGTSQCTTNASGQCTVNKNNINGSNPSATFTVTNVSHGSDTYDAGANHDPDGDSDGTSIIVAAP